MQQTEKYGFNLIEGGDDFLPDPLNENMVKVEAELAQKADAATQPRLCTTYYTGNGASRRTITFPFKPEVVILAASNSGSSATVLPYGCPSASYANSNSPFTLEWEDCSMTLATQFTDSSKAYIHYNSNGSQYMAIAIAA